jgi:hypothetical protein
MPWPATPDLSAQREPRVGSGLWCHQKRDSGTKYRAGGDAGADEGDRMPIRLSLERAAAWNGDGVRGRFAPEFWPPKAPRVNARCFFRGVVDSIH